MKQSKKQKISKGGNGLPKDIIRSKKSNSSDEPRLEIMKTYKMYIGGAFPRTESGRYFTLDYEQGSSVNVCLGSRKDFRNAVVAARKAFDSWQKRTAYNRGQIIYRIAEMLEGRKDQFQSELRNLGQSPAQAKLEVSKCIDRVIYHAGWADKFGQVFSSVNPVAGSYFNFSAPEPAGLVAVICPDEPGLLGLISLVMPVIVGGNSCILLASETKPTLAIAFAEAIHTSDLPGGVINILTGRRSELVSHFSSHMDVNAVIYGADDKADLRVIKELSSKNVKRVLNFGDFDWYTDSSQNPYLILDTQEIKTTWHPIGT